MAMASSENDADGSNILEIKVRTEFGQYALIESGDLYRLH